MKVSRLLVVLGILLLCVPSAFAQQSDTRLADTIRALRLRELSRHAGTIFYGRVLKVEAPPVVIPAAGSHEQELKRRMPAQPSIVKITFRVLTGFRGVETGQQFVLHEWAPLWIRHSRYRPGQTVVLFAYAAGPTGMSSPVGERGVISIKAGEIEGRKGASYQRLQSEIEHVLR